MSGSMGNGHTENLKNSSITYNYINKKCKNKTTVQYVLEQLVHFITVYTDTL